MALPKPDNLTLAAIWRFKHSHDGHVIMDWLKECLADQDVKNRMTVSEQVGRGQGRALCLQDLIEQIDKTNPGKL